CEQHGILIIVKSAPPCGTVGKGLSERCLKASLSGARPETDQVGFQGSHSVELDEFLICGDCSELRSQVTNVTLDTKRNRLRSFGHPRKNAADVARKGIARRDSTKSIVADISSELRECGALKPFS